MAQITKWLNGALVNHQETPQEIQDRLNPPPKNVRYLDIIERLPEAGAAAFVAFVDGLPVKERERIRFGGVQSDDATVRGHFTGQGQNPNDILR